MPRHPNAKETWNYITEFYADPCDAPFSVYVTTLYPAIMEALITYYAIDVIQMFTGFVRPGGPLKGGRGGGHGGGYRDPDVERRKRKRPGGGRRTWSKRWRVWTGFDPSEWLGSQAAKALGIGGRPVTPGVATAWNVYGLEQRAVYYIFLAELAQEFVYDWAAGVAASEYCQQQYRPWCYATSPRNGKLGVVYEDPLPLDVVEKGRGVIYAAGNLISVKGKGSSCVFQGKFTAGSGEPGNFLRLKHSSGIQIDGPQMTQNGSTYAVSGAALEEGGWSFYGCGHERYVMEDCQYTVIGNQPVYAPGDAD